MEPITLASMKVTNFGRIADATVTFSAGTTYISGGNGEGKSWFCRAVQTLFFEKGAAGAHPLKAGTAKGEIIGTLSNGLVCRMGVTENGVTELRITDSSSEMPNKPLGTPRAILDKLISSLAFDPMRFIQELNAKQQLDEIKRICKLDFAEIDKQRATLFAKRTDINREHKAAEATLASMPPHDATAPAAEISTVDLMDKLSKAQAYNRETEAMAKHIDVGRGVLQQRLQAESGFEAKRNELLAALATLDKDRADNREAIAAIEQQIAAKSEALTERPAANTQAIEQQIANSGAENRKLANNKARAEAQARVTKWATESAALTSQIDAIDAEKLKRVSEAAMPIDGLGITDECVTYRGLPLEAASTREQMEVSFAICASLNPTLRTVIIPHGSLITASNRPHFEALATKYGMQPLVELADDSGTVPGIVIRDGVASQIGGAP